MATAAPIFKHPMELALFEAEMAAMRDEVPVGAVITNDAGQVIASAGNRTRELKDPTAHAEVLVVREACQKLQQERLTGYDLWVTLEPCPLCAAAISFARIRRLYFGAFDPKSGAVENGVQYYADPSCYHAPETYGGIYEHKAGELLKVFFEGLR